MQIKTVLLEIIHADLALGDYLARCLQHAGLCVESIMADGDAPVPAIAGMAAPGSIKVRLDFLLSEESHTGKRGKELQAYLISIAKQLQSTVPNSHAGLQFGHLRLSLPPGYAGTSHLLYPVFSASWYYFVFGESGPRHVAQCHHEELMWKEWRVQKSPLIIFRTLF